MLYCRLIYMLSILCVRLTIKVKVGLPESFKVGWYPPPPKKKKKKKLGRVTLRGATKVFKHRQKSLWVPTLTEPFPNDQENAGSWLGTKNALYYCAQSANSFSWVLFVSSYTTAIISPQSETKELPMSRKTFRMLSAGAIQFALRKFCFWRITMYRK